jgi:hypothetical protein
MLSRTADNLFWLARYVERAEYLARIIEASIRLANLPSAYPAPPTNGNRRLPLPAAPICSTSRTTRRRARR